METLSAVYVRMNASLCDLARVTLSVRREITRLKDSINGIGISWKGTAYEAYSRRLYEDLESMEQVSEGMVTFSSLLYIALTRYQDTELKVADIIGGLGR